MGLDMNKIYIGKVTEVILDDFGVPTSELRIRIPSLHGSDGAKGVPDSSLPIAKPLIFPGTIFSKVSFSKLVNSIKIAYVVFEAGMPSKPVYFGVRTDSSIYDVSSLTEVEIVDFESADLPAYKKGRVFYNADSNFLSYYNENENITVNIGNDLLKPVINKTASTIPKGKVVYFTGEDAETGRLTIDLADCSTRETSYPVALTIEEIPPDGRSYIKFSGTLSGIDTSSLNQLLPIYLDPSTPGGLTSTKPGEGIFHTMIGKVKKSDASEGEIELDISYSADVPYILEYASSDTIGGIRLEVVGTTANIYTSD